MTALISSCPSKSTVKVVIEKVRGIGVGKGGGDASQYILENRDCVTCR